MCMCACVLMLGAPPRYTHVWQKASLVYLASVNFGKDETHSFALD